MNIEIKDFENDSYKRENESRKIKFKQSSFSVIYNTFKDFIKRKLVNLVDKKLEKAKQDLVNVEFKRGDYLVNYDGTTNKEKILTKKTESIDRLSKILNFLERGNYKRVPAPGEEDNRPLRLRRVMEDGLRANVGNVERIDENQKEEVMEKINEVMDDTKKTIEEETKILNDKIGDIQENLPENENVEENFENIRIEDVREQVEESFNQEDNEQVASTDDIKEAIEEQFNTEENKEETVEENEEEKEEAIAFADVKGCLDFLPTEEKVAEVTPITNIEKREIGVIQGLPWDQPVPEEKVEEKDEPIRVEPVIVPDREEDSNEKENEEFKEAEETYNKIINGTEDEKVTTEEVEKTDEEIYEETSEIPEEKVSEEKKEIPEEENIGFDFSDASINDIKKAAEVTTSQKDLAAMMEKIRMLKKEEERTQKQIEKAREEEAAKEAKLQETYKMFDDYCNALEARCNKNLEEREAIINKSREKDDVINKMLSAMDMNEDNNTKKKK